MYFFVSVTCFTWYYILIYSLGNTSLPALNFDDIDFDDINVEKENTGVKPAENEPVLNLGDKLDKEISSEIETTKLISADKEDQITVDNDATVESTIDVNNKENVDNNKIGMFLSAWTSWLNLIK